MSLQTIDFEQIETVTASICSVREKSIVFIIGQGIVVETELAEKFINFFKPYELTTRVFHLHGIAQYTFIEDYEVQLIGFKIESYKLIPLTTRRDFLNNFIKYGASNLGSLEDPYISLFIEKENYS